MKQRVKLLDSMKVQKCAIQRDVNVPVTAEKLVETEARWREQEKVEPTRVRRRRLQTALPALRS